MLKWREDGGREERVGRGGGRETQTDRDREREMVGGGGWTGIWPQIVLMDRNT